MTEVKLSIIADAGLVRVVRHDDSGPVELTR